MEVRRTYKFRLYPTKRQRTLLRHTLQVCRELYNAALQERRDAYRKARRSVGYVEQANQLPAIKQDRPDVAAVHSQVLQDVLRRVDKAFQAFFRRVKAGENPGYARFQGAGRYHSFTYPQGGWSLSETHLTLSKLGPVRLVRHRAITGEVKTVTISQDGEYWYACLSVVEEITPPLHTGPAVGLDLGLTAFASLSNGDTIDNPRYFRRGERHLAKVQRRLAKIPLRNPQRRKARVRVANAHRRVRQQRSDFLQQRSHQLVTLYSLIAVEDLTVKGLARGMLAKSVADAGWSAFLMMLAYKAAWAGARVVEVDPRYTSQTCPACGAVRPKALSERWHSCPCGCELPRDVASAQVILARGLASLGVALDAPAFRRGE